VKNDISPKGFKIVKGRGALSKLSNDLRKLHKEAIAIKNLEAHLYINKDSKLVMDSVENVIHIVARYRKRMKDYPFCWQTNKIKYTNYWLRWILKEKSGKYAFKFPKEGLISPEFHRIPHMKGSETEEGKYACKFPKEGLISPEFHRIPHMKGSETVKKVTDCSTLDELNRATVVPLVDPSAPDVDLLNSISVEEQKKTIEVDHPIFPLLALLVTLLLMPSTMLHAKKGEHNNLHDSEFAICNYLKFGMSYHFYMTIEAIEEGNLGTYLAEVICNSSGGARTLCKFVLTDQEPLGTKALAVYYLSCLRTIYKTVDG
ncbi:hypothetical protein Tco_0880213, partial [Tanacetum coccineum]